MSTLVQTRSEKVTHWIQRAVLYGGVLFVVFLLGLGPMWWRSRALSNSLSDAQSQLNQARTQNSLASAVIDARRGDYDTARQEASTFFTLLRTEADNGNASALSAAQREGVQPLFTRRDEIITLLARGDPTSAEQLSELYASYRKILNK